MNIDTKKAKFIMSLAKFLLICYEMTAERNARYLWWTNQELSPVDITPPWFYMPIFHMGDKQ
jgi:quinol-cytochrome oxidoreductase complex cytochrome b subunit